MSPRLSRPRYRRFGQRKSEGKRGHDMDPLRKTHHKGGRLRGKSARSRGLRHREAAPGLSENAHGNANYQLLIINSIQLAHSIQWTIYRTLDYSALFPRALSGAKNLRPLILPAEKKILI